MYPDFDGCARGSLVLDDGWSTSIASSQFIFSLNEYNEIWIETDPASTFKSKKFVTQVIVYGVSESPDYVYDIVKQNNTNFWYNWDEESLLIDGF